MSDGVGAKSYTLLNNKALLAGFLCLACAVCIFTGAEIDAFILFGLALVISIFISKSALAFDTSPRRYATDTLIFMFITYFGWGIAYVLNYYGFLSDPRKRELTIAFVIPTIFFSPIIEEFLYRHVLMKIRKFVPTMTACAVSGLIFYLTHGHENIGTLFAGAYWAYLYQRNESLVPCILLHMGHNLFAASAKMLTSQMPDASHSQLPFIYLGLNIAAHSLFFIVAMLYLRFQKVRSTNAS